MVQRTNGSVGAGQATRRFGSRGLSIWGGEVREEYLTSLQDWGTQFKVYREMMEDATIGTLFDAMFGPLLRAEFDVTPAGETPGDDDAAKFLWDCINAMRRQTWRSHVTDMLEAVPFGFAIAEAVFEKRADGRLWLASLDPRGQETLSEWVFGDDENVEAFVQRVPTTGAIVSIPAAKLVHMTFRGRKGNPMGKPMLRSLYRPWKFQKNLENLEGVGVERDVGGTPVYTDPEGYTASSDDDTEIDKMLEGLRMDETVYARIPFGAKLEGFGGGAKMYDVGAIIERKKKEILMRAFAQFLMLGMEQVGTQALVQGSQDFFSLALGSVQQSMLATWQNQLVPLVFSLNSFSGMTDLPKLDWAAPGQRDIAGILDSYQKGVSANLITPVPEDEDHFRGVMDLPDRPEGVGEGERGAPAAQPAFPGFFSKEG